MKEMWTSRKCTQKIHRPKDKAALRACSHGGRVGPCPQEHQALSGGGMWPQTPFTEASGPPELTARRYPCVHLGPGHAQATVCPLLVCPGRGCRSLAPPRSSTRGSSGPFSPSTRAGFPSLCHRCPLTENHFFPCVSLESFPIKTQISGFPWESGSLGDRRKSSLPARRPATGTEEPLDPSQASDPHHPAPRVPDLRPHLVLQTSRISTPCLDLRLLTVKNPLGPPLGGAPSLPSGT